MQISQDTGTADWYSYLFMNFFKFVVTHIVIGFSVVNEAEVDFFFVFFLFLNFLF